MTRSVRAVLQRRPSTRANVHILLSLSTAATSPHEPPAQRIAFSRNLLQTLLICRQNASIPFWAPCQRIAGLSWEDGLLPCSTGAKP